MFQKTLPAVGGLTLLISLALIFIAPGLSADMVEVPGQTVVEVKSPGQIGSILRRFDATLVDSVEGTSTYLLQLPPDRDYDSAMAGLNRNPMVESAHGNFLVDVPETFQISQGFPDQRPATYVFAESPADYFSQPSTYATGIDSAQVLATGAGVVVAAIDNGLVFDHPILQDMQVVEGRDVLDDDNDPSESMDGLYTGHGTFVTSLVWLTAPDCQIMPIRAFDGDGVGDIFSLIKAVYWAETHGARIINLSCGVHENSPVLRSAIQSALSSGVIVVSASGNGGDDAPNYPAAFEGVISVGAIDSEEYRADFTSYGQSLDLMAPGVNVYGALPGESDWGTWSGTSFSAPLVSGTAAMVLQRDPTISPGQMQDHLRASARADLNWGTINPPDSEYGYGALNALSAVVSVTAGDIDLSGQRDIVDIQLLSAYVNSDPDRPCNSVTDMLADVNCDGILSVHDIEEMAGFFNGQRVRWQVCYH